jgi:hypothetical protein
MAMGWGFQCISLKKFQSYRFVNFNPKPKGAYMGRQARYLTSILLVALAIAPLVYADGDSCDWNAGTIDEIGPAANLGDPDAATLVAVEQAANIGDSNAAMLMAAEQAANIGEWTLAIEHAATFGDPEDAALACYFGPC